MKKGELPDGKMMTWMKIKVVAAMLVVVTAAVTGVSAAGMAEAAGEAPPVPLLPGAHCFDATKPPFLATPDDETDDTVAIQKALNAAAAEAANLEWNKETTAQQIVYLPQGTYLVSDTLVFPKNIENGDKHSVECFQWLYGAGMGRTIIRLRPSSDGKRLGSPHAPQPVVQVAEYRFDNRAGGNINFQLWVTDLSIVVPADQPYAVGLSYGCANMGAVRRVEIRAEKGGGHTGLGLVQYNNGPGFIEDIRVSGFDTGVEINDNWGESFTFNDLTIERQNPGGVGLSVSDKLIAVEKLTMRQDQPDVTGIRLHDGVGQNSLCGGAPHLSLLSATIENESSGAATAPAIDIRVGHCYLRNLTVRGYGAAFLRDHGKPRTFANDRIPDEFVSVHGRAIGEEAKVAVTANGTPARSLNLPEKPAPEIPPEAWRALAQEDFTRMDDASLRSGRTKVSTAWVVVDPSGADDDTALLQAALDSGARYVGLLNQEAFRVAKTLVVNGAGTPRRVEVIYGLMSEILAAADLAGRKPPYERVHEGVLFRLETGEPLSLHIKGLRIQATTAGTDFTLFQNAAAATVVFEDIRAKIGPRHYRNAGTSVGNDIFIENVEWAYNDAFPQNNLIFTGQHVWARNLNTEMNITPTPVTLKDDKGRTRTFSRFSTKTKITNDGGTLWSFGQKVGEYNGPFFDTCNGGRTELISVFLNEANDPKAFPPTTEAVCLIVQGGGTCSLVGQERPRGPKNVPHANHFARLETAEGKQVVPATAFPTYLVYGGFDPFKDADAKHYFEQNTFRVFGLFRSELPRKE